MRIGLVGAGHLGAAMGRTLLRAGFEVAVNDVRPERIDLLVAAGATAAPSLGEMAANVDVVSIVVVNDEQLRDVVATVAERAQPSTPVIVHSTVLPETIVELAELAQTRAIHLVDAPITGGAEKADLGTLTLMLGGDKGVIQSCWPIFEALGQEIFYVGPSGAGAVIKAVNNLMSYGTYALALEAMSVAAAFGIDEDTITEVLCTGAADSRVLRTWGRTDRTRADPEAGMHHVYDRAANNIQVAAVTAAARGIVLPVTSVIVGCLGEKVRRRDEELARAPRPPIPRCRVCNQELAAPFRQAGTHPECVTIHGRTLMLTL